MSTLVPDTTGCATCSRETKYSYHKEIVSLRFRMYSTHDAYGILMPSKEDWGSDVQFYDLIPGISYAG